VKNAIVRKFAVISLAALALSPLCRAQSQIAGDWQGTLNAGGVQLRLALHVAAAKDGSLTATLDSLDQGAIGIPVTSVTLKDSKLSLTVDAVHGTYEGTINKDATEIDGTWSQGQPLTLNFKRAPAQAIIAPKPAAPSDIDGSWLGTLDAGAVKLRIVFKIVNTQDGLTAQLQSPDQSPVWVTASSVARSGSSLTIAFSGIGGVYDGKIGADLSSIDGTFTQAGNPLPLAVKRATGQAEAEFVSPKAPVKPSDIDGTWLGTLDAGAVKFRLVLKIVNWPDGLGASLQDFDQSPQWIPATSIKRSGNSLNFTIEYLGAVYDGKIDAGLNSIDGTFTQGGVPRPLALKRVKDQAELETQHPQNPVKPYPYREEEMTYANKAAGNTLAGTLTIPPGKGPFPAVLLISGSGPNDRDESALGHKPFLVLSDYLTRKGIVVLRADKRGIGKSTGDLAKATYADFAADAEAGVQYLKTRAEVDPHRIGLIGHSEGGTIAPMVAAGDPGVRFIVLMAGPGVRGDQLVVEQKRLIEEASGVTKEQAAQDAVRQRELFALVENEKDGSVLDKELRAKLAGQIPEAQVDAAIQDLTSPWFRYLLTYDPATALRKVACPVLVLNGEKDLQVPPAQNLPAIRKALENGGNKHFEVDELPGLNHLFQTAKTGAPAEYAEIEETMSPVALDKIASWILKQ
jgi:fermentation-respiration switch protein FrsA (DUF1100 family)